MLYEIYKYSTSTNPQETVSSSGNKSTGSGTSGLFLILLLPSAEHLLQTFVLWSPHWMGVQKVSHTVLHFMYVQAVLIYSM